MSWNVIDASTFKGVKVEGDASAPKTRWWLLPLLFLFFWKKRAVLSVVPYDVPDGFRIGYKPFEGPARLLDKVIKDKRIQVRIGHEDCTFFALTPEGNEIFLRLSGVTHRSDKWLKRVPLY